MADPKCDVCGKALRFEESITAGRCGICRGHGLTPPVTAGILDGVAPDAPTGVNAAGGKQSVSPYRCDLLPPLALLAVAKVLKHGADKYGANNWHLIPVADHVNHALAHLYALAAGDARDDHLEHAACRILFALDQQLADRPGNGGAA